MDSQTRSADRPESPPYDVGTPTVAGSPRAERDPSPELKPGDPVDRYSILDLLGSGGMGRVYAAYDPRLDRKVALKLLRSTGGGRRKLEARLLREAQALAQVSHPNVLTVFDVGTFGGRVFLAVEYVEGTHLGEWLRQDKRGRSEILDVFLQAGRGLAAAHRHGLVHRDFKPGNVMVRAEDGRALVLDFGLARSIDSTVEPDDHEDDPHDSPRRLDQRLTRMGSILGTPAFMAPEQWHGQTSAAGDQFSFCASLFTALYRRLPFDPEQHLSTRFQHTPEADDTAEVPPWLRKVLLRGLSLEPGDRYPSMDALLKALEDDPLRRRRRRLGLIAAGLGMTAAGFLWPRGSVPCAAGDRLMAEVWSPADRGHLTSSLAAAAPHGLAQTRTVTRLLDEYAERWRHDYLDACEATHVRGDQSLHLLDRRMACLQLRRREMGSLVTLITESSTDHDFGVWLPAVENLSPLSECADAAALMSPQRPPADPDARRKIEDLQGRLADNHARLSAGRYAEAQAEAQTLVAEAETLDHLPVLAESLLLLGQAQEQQSQGQEAAATLEKAIAVAQAGGHDQVGAEAFIRLVRINGHLLKDFDQGDLYARLAEGNLRRLDRGDRLQAELADHRGILELARGDLERAFDFHSRALDLHRRQLGDDHPVMARSLVRLGTVSHDLGRFREALELLEDALRIQEQSLGDHHPEVAATLDRLGNVSLRLGDLQTAKERLQRALDILTTSLGPNHPNLTPTMMHLAATLTELGEHQRALELHERTLPLFERQYGDSHPNVATAWNNIGATYYQMMDFDGALDGYTKALEIQRQTLGDDHLALATSYYNLGEVWNEKADFHQAITHHRQALTRWRRHLGEAHYLIGYALTGLGRAYLGLGRSSEAAPLLEEALDLWRDQQLESSIPAWTQWLLARAVRSQDATQARDLARQALAGYQQSATKQTLEIEQIESFLADLDA